MKFYLILVSLFFFLIVCSFKEFKIEEVSIFSSVVINSNMFIEEVVEISFFKV